MGQFLAKKVTKPIRTFNVDNRAQRVLTKEKLAPAPKHKTDSKWQMPQEMKADIEEKVTLKREDLLKRLTDVRVDSDGNNPVIAKTPKFPEYHKTGDLPLFGFDEPKVVPKGKILFRHAMEAIMKHAETPDKYGPEQINKDFGIEVRDAELMLRYLVPYVALDTAKEEERRRLMDHFEYQPERDTGAGLIESAYEHRTRIARLYMEKNYPDVLEEQAEKERLLLEEKEKEESRRSLETLRVAEEKSKAKLAAEADGKKAL